MSPKKANWPTLITVAALALALLQFLFGNNLVERIPAPVAETTIRLAWQVGPAVALLGVVAYLLARVKAFRTAKEQAEVKLAQEQAMGSELQAKLEGTAATLAKTEAQLQALQRTAEEEKRAERERRTVQPVPHNPPGDLLDFDVTIETLGRGCLVALEAARGHAVDASLEFMSITFEPFIKCGGPLYWAYSFFSAALGRSYYFSCFPGSPVEEVVPSAPRPGARVLAELPWVECPDWLGTLRQAYKQVGPLPQSEGTRCHVFVSAAAAGRAEWDAQFDDGETGHLFKFQWSPAADLRLVSSTKM